jgi:hypothetical protein
LITDGDVPSIRACIKNANLMSLNGRLTKNDVFIVPTPENRDPFNLFYEEDINAEDYVSSQKLSPKEFLLRNYKYLGKNITEIKNFLLENTRHIVNLEDLVDLEIVDKKDKFRSLQPNASPIAVSPLVVGEKLFRESYFN